MSNDQLLYKHKHYIAEYGLIFRIVQLCKKSGMATGRTPFNAKTAFFDIYSGKEISQPTHIGWDLVKEV